jgi:hypothetical protein
LLRQNPDLIRARSTCTHHSTLLHMWEPMASRGLARGPRRTRYRSRRRFSTQAPRLMPWRTCIAARRRWD